MKVTLDEDEFKKFDNGETHSDSGLRSENGKLSALSDIAPLSEDELLQREVVRTEVVYEPVKDHSFGTKIAQAGVDIVGDILSDPEVQEDISLLAKTYWHYKVKPKIVEQVQKIKDGFH